MANMFKNQKTENRDRQEECRKINSIEDNLAETFMMAAICNGHHMILFFGSNARKLQNSNTVNVL